MFHQDSDDNVDQDELSHEDEDDEEHRRNDRTDAAVGDAIRRRVAFLSQSILPRDNPTI